MISAPRRPYPKWKKILIPVLGIMFFFAAVCFWLRVVNDPSRFPWIYRQAYQQGGYSAQTAFKGMAHIPPGSFLMGRRPGDWFWEGNEKPQHRVVVQGFWLDKCEVTNLEYHDCVEAAVCKPSKFGADPNWNAPDQPVVGISWVDAELFCRWKGKRLPTEAEWEYAARAGVEGMTYGELDSVAWYLDNADMKTHPVGQKAPNFWGLYDMLGNVWEWCEDWYSRTYYRKSPLENPVDRGGLFNRVARGGCWISAEKYVRLANRAGWYPTYTSKRVGFRCAK